MTWKLKFIKEMREYCEEKGVEPHDLEDAVQAITDKMATIANNGGVSGQLVFLMNHFESETAAYAFLMKYIGK